MTKSNKMRYHVYPIIIHTYCFSFTPIVCNIWFTFIHLNGVTLSILLSRMMWAFFFFFFHKRIRLTFVRVFITIVSTSCGREVRLDTVFFFFFLFETSDVEFHYFFRDFRCRKSVEGVYMYFFITVLLL